MGQALWQTLQVNCLIVATTPSEALFPYITDEEVETWGDRVIRPRSHGWQDEEPGLGQDSSREHLYPMPKLSTVVLLTCLAKRVYRRLKYCSAHEQRFNRLPCPRTILENRWTDHLCYNYYHNNKEEEAGDGEGSEPMTHEGSPCDGLSPRASCKCLQMLFLDFYKYRSAESLGFYSDNYLKCKLHTAKYGQGHTPSSSSGFR